MFELHESAKQREQSNPPKETLVTKHTATASTNLKMLDIFLLFFLFMFNVLGTNRGQQTECNT